MAKVKVALAIAGVCLVGGAALANDYAVTVRGWMFCHDGTTGADVPLAGARVELMDSDCEGSEICDDVMGAAYIRSDGSFEVRGVGGDGGSWSWSKPDVYVRVLYTDDRLVRLTNEMDQLRGASTPHDEHDDAEGVIDVGAWITGAEVVSPPASTQCGVFLAAKGSVDDYLAVVGTDPPAGKYDVLYWSAVFDGTPWTNLDTSHWPVHYRTGVVNDHEFAHSVRHSFDGDQDHFNWDVVRFRYARYHSHCDSEHLAETRANREGFAFNEGWAEYWEGYTSRCGDWPDMETEGNVAAALKGLSTCPGVGKAGMVAVLKSSPGAIHSYGEFLAQYQRLYAACGTGTTSSPLTSGEHDMPPPSRSAQLGWAKQEIARIDKVIALLREELGAAQNAAGVKVPCDPKQGCGEVLAARIRPAMLEARIAHATLVRGHIERSLDPEWGSALSDTIAKGALEAWLIPVRANYEKRSCNIVRTAFRDALAAIGDLPPGNKEVELARDELRREAAAFESLAASGKSLPPHLVAYEAVFTEGVARRDGPPLGKPKLDPKVVKRPINRPPM